MSSGGADNKRPKGEIVEFVAKTPRLSSCTFHRDETRTLRREWWRGGGLSH